VITALSLQAGSLRLAAAGDDHVIYVWELSTGTLVQRLEGHGDWVHTLAYAPDGRVLASAGHDRQLIFWDATTGQRRFVLSGARGAVTKLAWSHDGNRLATTAFDGQVRVYDVTRHRLQRELEGPSPDLRAVAFSPDDRLLATGGRNGVVRVWSTEDFAVRHEYAAHRQRIRALQFSPDDQQLVSAGEDQRIYAWSLPDQRGQALSTRPAKLLSLAFFGPHEVAVGGSDNRIRLCDLSALTEIGCLAGHEGSVAALTSDHHVLISAGFDATVRIWTIEDRVAEQPQRLRERK
jgi:dipeptidyl aminopeptidase/acylaminoacyl peptidase